MLSLHFGPFLVVWKVGWDEMSFKVPWKAAQPGIAGVLDEQLAGQVFSGLGCVRREQLRAQVPPAWSGPRTNRKSSSCTTLTFAKGQDEVYVSLQSRISLS